MDSWGPLLKRQGIFHKANVPNNDILPRYLSRDTTLPALNSGRVKFLHVVLQKQKTKCQSFLQNTNCFFSYAIPKYTIICQKNFQLYYSKSSDECEKQEIKIVISTSLILYPRNMATKFSISFSYISKCTATLDSYTSPSNGKTSRQIESKCRKT